MSVEVPWPRRAQMQQWTQAEKAIYNAVQVVESMGAHVRLTDAVILLGKAREAVADFVDGITVNEPAENHHPPPLDYPGKPESCKECEELRKNFKELLELSSGFKAQRDNLANAAEGLWITLANVSGGDWSKQAPEWREAADGARGGLMADDDQRGDVRGG